MMKTGTLKILLLLSGIVLPLCASAHPAWMMDDESPGMGWGGHGMMMGGGGCGMGMGPMMGGGGMMGMPGMMMGGYGMLDLTDKQIAQFNDIQTKLQKEHWQIMGKMIDAQAKVREAWSADKPDPKKVGEAYSELAQLQRQAVEAKVTAMNKMYDALTDEQRQRLKSGPRGMWGPGGGSMHRGGHMMMQ